MLKLSDSQLVILSAATQRPDRLVLPLPDRLKGGAAHKVVDSLAAKGLVEEVEAKVGEPVWRETGDGHGVTLVATDAAFAALGIAPETAPASATDGNGQSAAADTPTVEIAAQAAPARKTRAGTKQSQMIDMLRRGEGATIEEIAAATGWQHHTVRGAFAGALKKKLGLDVTSERAEGRGRVYRIA